MIERQAEVAAHRFYGMEQNQNVTVFLTVTVTVSLIPQEYFIKNLYTISFRFILALFYFFPPKMTCTPLQCFKIMLLVHEVKLQRKICKVRVRQKPQDFSTLRKLPKAIEKSTSESTCEAFWLAYSLSSL